MKRIIIAFWFVLVALGSFAQQTGYKIKYPFWIINANFNLQSGTDTNQVISGEDTLQFFLDEQGYFHCKSKYPVMFERGVHTDTVYMDYFVVDSLKQSNDSMLLSIDVSGRPNWIHKDSVGSRFEGYWILTDNVLESAPEADTLKTSTWMQVQGRIGINTISTCHINYPLTVGSGNSFTPGTIYLMGACTPGQDTSGLTINGGYPEDDTDSAYFTHWGNAYRFTVDGNREVFLLGAEKAAFKQPVYMPSTVLGGDSIYELRKNGDTIFFNGGQFICNTELLWEKNGYSAYYNTGNVGIGTDAPSQKLEVDGQIKLDSVLRADVGRLVWSPSKYSLALDVYGPDYFSGASYSAMVGFRTSINGDYCYGMGSHVGEMLGGNGLYFGYEAGSGGIGASNTLFRVTGTTFNGANYNYLFSWGVGGYTCWSKLTTGCNNYGGGLWVAQNETTGSYNNYVGVGVARYSNGSNYNFGRGYFTMQNYDGAFSIFNGYNCATLLESGDAQNAHGKEAMRYAIGTNNNMYGEGAGKGSDTGGSDYDNCTGFGDLALNDLADNADDNTAFGAGAGENTTSGSDNTYVGKGAGGGNTTGSGNVFIGNEAGGLSTTTSNQLYIDNSNTTSPLIFGNFSTNDVTINGDLLVTGNSGDLTPGIFSDTDTDDRHLAIDVTGLSTIKINTSADNDTISGFTNGKAGQILYIFKANSGNSLIIKHQDAAATDEKIVLKGAADITITGYGGLVLINNGDYWFEIKY
jgi:hypothetical protein